MIETFILGAFSGAVLAFVVTHHMMVRVADRREVELLRQHSRSLDTIRKRDAGRLI